MTTLQEAQAIPIKYVGKKAEKHDTINHTGTIWKPGQTVWYPTRLAKGLLTHPEVWRLGKKEEIKGEDARMEEVVATDRAAQNTTEGAQGGTALHPQDDVTIAAANKDRDPSPSGKRATLE